MASVRHGKSPGIALLLILRWRHRALRIQAPIPVPHLKNDLAAPCYHCPRRGGSVTVTSAAIARAPDPRHVPTSLSRFVLAIALFALLAAAPATAADEPVTLNFVNADIEAVVRAVAEMTGRNFVLDPRVKGVINIVSARPVPVSLVYPTLLSALRLQGFAAVESDGVTKIVPEADAKQHASPVTRGPVTVRRRPAGDRGLRAQERVGGAARQRAAPAHHAQQQHRRGADRQCAGHHRLRRQPAAHRPHHRLARRACRGRAHHRAACATRRRSTWCRSSIACLPTTAARRAAAADPQQRVSVVADPRSNSILVRADNPARLARTRALIEQLDTPGRAGGNIFIIYLKNAEALHVAQTLRAVLGGGGDSEQRRQLAAVERAHAAQFGLLEQLGCVGPVEPDVWRGIPASSATPSASALGLSGASSSAGGGGGAGGRFSAGGATIQADTANNALVIMAPEPVYNNIRAVVEKLDIRRAQVYVEALIVEVTADKVGQFGMQWNLLNPNAYNTNATQVGGRHQFQRPRQRPEHPRRAGQPRFGGAGPQPRHHQGQHHHPRHRHHHQPGPARPGAGDRQQDQHPVDAESAHARQRRGQDRRGAERAVHHRPVCANRLDVDCHPVPDYRPPGRRPDPYGQAADHRGRQRALGDLRGSLVDCLADQPGRDHHQQALAGLVGHRRRRPDHRARRTDPGLPHRQRQPGAVSGRHSLHRRAVSLRQPGAHQDQPDGVPEADGGALGCGGERAHDRPLRVPDGRAATAEAAAAAVLDRAQRAAAAAAAGLRPASACRPIPRPPPKAP